MAEYGWLQWPAILALTATSLSTLVIAQAASTYTSAYKAAPHELAAYLDTADFSMEENENYDRDVAKVQRLEDKIRLGRLVRKIQEANDELREELNHVVVNQAGAATTTATTTATEETTLRTSARLMWAAKRCQIEHRVRRLEMLRMCFLVAYMGIIAANNNNSQKMLIPPVPADPEKIQRLQLATATATTTATAAVAAFETPPVTPTKSPTTLLSRDLAQSIENRPPMRRLTTQAIGHNDNVAHPHRHGWAGVVQELQKSPKLQQRHASIEQAMHRASS